MIFHTPASSSVTFRPCCLSPGRLSPRHRQWHRASTSHRSAKLLASSHADFSSIADILGVGFCPIRKAGKLPGNTISETYGLEYGSDTLEIQAGAITGGDRILLVDDVLATGGTLTAATRLVRTAGAVVAGVAVLIELDFLGGRGHLGALDIAAVIHY